MKSAVSRSMNFDATRQDVELALLARDLRLSQPDADDQQLESQLTGMIKPCLHHSTQIAAPDK